MNRLHFTEKEVDVVDFIEVTDTDQVTTKYHPVVKFEGEGKVCQGRLSVYPHWTSKEQRKVTILYHPQNPGEFVAKETSSSPATGCIFAIVLSIALGVAIFYYIHHH